MGSIAFKETPTAPKDTAWDGSQQVAAASVDDLKIMCAWVDSENAENKTAYKLPHHEADGEHAVVWRGVANAMARLPQTDIPASDKKAVYNHLAKHYAQFDESPPEMKDVLDDEDVQIETKYLEASITKAQDGSFVAVASTNSVDRHGEIVDNNGWDLKSFKKNPVILWAHDHTEPAIGVAKKIWVDGEGNKAKLMIQPILHDVTEKAKAIKALVDQGIIKTLSVGFRPLESPDGVTFTKNELLEVSMVNVPANADAMMLAYKSLKKEGFHDKTISSLGIKAIDEAAMMKKMQQAQASVQTALDHMNDMMGMMGKPAKQLVDMIAKDDTITPETEVKADTVNPQESRIVKERLSMLKVIARASDKILEGEKKDLPKGDRVQLTKVIKKAAELITVQDKQLIK